MRAIYVPQGRILVSSPYLYESLRDFVRDLQRATTVDVGHTLADLRTRPTQLKDQIRVVRKRSRTPLGELKVLPHIEVPIYALEPG